MAISLLAGGKQVPTRQKPVGQAEAMPVAQPSQKLEIATPEWIRPILDRIAAPVEKDDDSALAEAIAKLQQEVGPIASLKAELAAAQARAEELAKQVAQLTAELKAARAVKAPLPTPAVKADNRGFYLTIERGADDRMRGITVKRTE